MKTEKELNLLKTKLNDLCNEIKELNEDELDIVTGGKAYLHAAGYSTPNPQDMLQGKIAGVNIASDTSGPSLNVLIKGKHYFAPVVVYGFNGLTDIDPSDIENFTVLK